MDVLSDFDLIVTVTSPLLINSVQPLVYLLIPWIVDTSFLTEVKINTGFLSSSPDEMVQQEGERCLPPCLVT